MTTDTLSIALDKMRQARDDAYNDLKEFIKNLPEQMVRTVPTSDTPTIYATIETYNMSLEFEQQQIYAIKYVESEDDLYLCTDFCLANYEFDTKYSFESLYDFNEEDKEELEKVFADETYFISFDEDYILKSATLISILAGLPSYVK